MDQFIENDADFAKQGDYISLLIRLYIFIPKKSLCCIFDSIIYMIR